MKIILASQSPRRKELLNLLGIKFDIIPSDIDESVFNNLPPLEMAEKLSFFKAKNILEKYKQKDITIIGADTIVCIDEKVLGKPKNDRDAIEMLSLLNSKEHIVITGLTVIGYKDGFYFETITNSISKVKFGEYSLKEIEDYVKSGEPMDKAGAYAIQGKGSFLIEKIEGDYNTIVGLPLQKLYKILCDYKIINL